MSANPAHPQTTAGQRRFKRRPLIGALAILIVGLGAWYLIANIGHWKDRFVPRKLRTIDPGRLYASGQINQHLLRQVLQQDHIGVIVALDADDPSDPDVAGEIRDAKELGIERFVDPLNGDGTGDIRQYADAVAQVAAAEKAGKPVLLHCSSGAQRSNGATFYYRVFIDHWPADQAAAEMIRNYHDPRANPKLIPYLNEHMAEMAKLLVEKGIIERVPEPLPRIEELRQ